MACGDNPVGPSDVVQRNWQLVAMQQPGGTPTAVDNPSRYTLRLEDNGRLRVMADCNSCGGSYSLDGSSVEFQSVACTRAFCGAASLDTVFVRALEGARTISIDDDEMTLRGSGATLRFRLQR